MREHMVSEDRNRAAGAGSALRLSVTGLCNLKCSYCYLGNGSGSGCGGGAAVKDEGASRMLLPDMEELIRYCELVIETFNVVKVRLTGGEPLIRKDIDVIARRMKGFDPVRHVGITTNGQLLETWAGRLKAAGTDSVNVSLDSLKPERYRKITGGGSLKKVIAGIRAAREAGIEKIKANCVVMGGVNDDEIKDMIEFSLNEGFELRFLELMSFDGSSEKYDRQFVSKDEILKRVSRSYEMETLPWREEQTARMYSVSGDGGKGVVGIIGSSDGTMCLRCNRIRITADGRLRRCLKDPFEVDLAGMVRMGVPGEIIMEKIKDYMDMKSRPAPLIGAGSMMRIGG